jgi:polyvinyl alcohol dehydrogenase (cytochrome)
VWQTFTISPSAAAGGAAGASVWTSPAYDATLNTVFIATGNNFANKPGTPTTRTSDALIALDAATGRITWLNQRTSSDTWVVAYPEGHAHPDYDFGDSPEVFHLANGRIVVAAGQKSGFLHLLDARTGRTLDQQQFLPSGELGGYFADSAVDGDLVIGDGNDWTSYGGGETGGLVDTLTGQIIAQKPPKAGEVVATRARPDGTWALAWRFRTPGKAIMDAVAVANGIVYVGATQAGRVYALDAATGRVLDSVAAGPSVSGPAVAGDGVYLGFGDTFGYAGTDPTKGGVLRLSP